jgi:hypothetical protein
VAAPASEPAPAPNNDQLTALANEVAALRAELNQLKQQLGVESPTPSTPAGDNI